ncbi:sensor histidine kinase [Natranaeroarchaeum sulfidigenes]|uniref:histidine kinase n=1 Tax=Natranaeroarchaeum sulfidigenes TaxID=2784880 RepID=A0A897N0U2_9EURY|nr:ATP-binding protein [Natranaeroarchaeum sulfidigenes]QSG04295.1 Signal transduction histidine kinase [Natranaeroarchaeum sulfidigenes]
MTDRPPLDVLLVGASETLDQVERALDGVDDAATVQSVPAPDGIADHDPDIAVVCHDADAGIEGTSQLSMVRLRLPDVPVVVIANDPGTDFVSEAFDTGAADVMSLPPEVRIDEDMPVAADRRLRYAAGKGGEFASDSELLDSLMEYLPHQVFIKDDRGRIAEASSIAAEEYGLTREQMIGLTDQELFSPEYARDLWAEESEIMETEDPVINRTEHYTDEAGSDRWINVTKAPRYDSDDTVVGIIGTAVDVSDQKRQEQMVNALHAASRDLMSAQSREEIAEIVVDIADDIPDLPVVQVLLVADDGVEPVCTGETANSSAVFDAQRSWCQHAFETGDSQFIHLPSNDAAPVVRTETEIEDVSEFEPHVVTIPLGDHGVLGFGATGDSLDEFGIDLADVLAANVETALSRMTHEEALRAREQELARQNERLEEFAGIVSHDIRNPLSIAKGYLPQTEVDDESKDEIRHSLDRMERLTDELLTLAKKGQVVGETTPVSLDAVARSAWQEVSTPGVSLEVVSGDAQIEADRDRLVELLANLFTNSVEHGSGPTDSPVVITVGTTPTGFFVEDDGPGIPETERAKVFEQGYTNSDTGTGFGLYIVRTLAEAHGWSVSVDDAALSDTGARFEIDTTDR